MKLVSGIISAPDVYENSAYGFGIFCYVRFQYMSLMVFGNC